jgi:Tfp pilus assembly PilM family ATPase
MTKALMNTFNLPGEKAEGYKITYGLNQQHFEGKIANALLPIANIILGDIRNTMTYFSSIDSLSVIERMIISGGPAQTPGFLEFLMTNLNLEILPAEPFYGLMGQVAMDNLLMYPVVAGLAKKKFE